MNLDEYVLLEALNIASTQYGLAAGDGYRATAAQIAQVLNEDERFEPERLAVGAPVDARWVGARIGRLRDESRRRAALVERVDSRHWRLSDAAVKALIA